MIFRGKTKAGEWVEGDLSIGSAEHGWDESKIFIIPRQPLLERIEIIPLTLAQSTGLKDKHGKMIFGSIPVDEKMSEGGSDVRFGNRKKNRFIGRIFYEDQFCAFGCWENSLKNPTFYFCSENMEIIDNPELI